MSVIRKILASLDRMSPADREIGRFIVDNPEKMLGLSSTALAVETGRSQSSVVKFAQRLGFTSYQDLKLAISSNRTKDWHTPAAAIHGSIEKGDRFGTIFEKLLSSKIMSMQQTMAANGEREVTSAVAALSGARRIYLAGAGASALVASDFAFKLLKIARVVIYGGDSHIQMANVSGMTGEDVLVAVSYSGSSQDTVKIAKLAKTRRAKVISITGMQDSPLARLSDILLHTVADEDKVRSSSITARDAQLTLTDLLFLLLLQDQSDAHSFIHASEKAVTALKHR
jgi:DNA-binding MurR/RpiR family transcriptional regulator